MTAKRPTIEDIKPMQENMVKIALSYGTVLVLPTKEATQLLSLVGKAEPYIGVYKEPDRIGGKLPEIVFTTITKDEYMEAKLEYLINPPKPEGE